MKVKKFRMSDIEYFSFLGGGRTETLGRIAADISKRAIGVTY